MTHPRVETTNEKTVKGWLGDISTLVQVLSVVVGVVISVLSFNYARQQEADARKKEALARAEAERYRQMEASKPFLDLRQKLYLEAVQAAAVLSNPGFHTEEEKKKANKRFRELYVAELSLVEARGVEGAMKKLAKAVDPELLEFSAAQEEAYELAHSLRDSLVKSWQLQAEMVDNPEK